jgi:Na+-driven multidrug efflux pump
MTLVGKSLGADDESMAIRTGRIAGRVALLVSVAVVVVILLFHRTILSAFTSNQEVVEFGSQVIFALAIVQVPKAVNIVFSGNLRGGADLAWLMWLAIFSVITFETIGAYLLAFVFQVGLVGLWLIQAVDESTRLMLNYFRFKGKKWKILSVPGLQPNLSGNSRNEDKE